MDGAEERMREMVEVEGIGPSGYGYGGTASAEQLADMNVGDVVTFVLDGAEVSVEITKIDRLPAPD